MQLAVEERGAGPATVLLIHGLGARRQDLFETANALGEGFRCLLPDLRGHGDSPPASIRSVADYAVDLVPLARQSAPVAVVGLSFGSLVACELWRAEPESVGRVVLFDPLLDPRPLRAWAQETAGADAARALAAPYLEREPEALAAVLERYPLARDLDEDGRRRTVHSLLEADHATILETLELMGSDQSPGRPPGADAALTLLRTRDSLVCPPETAAAFARRFDAHVEEIACGHNATLSAPRVLGEAIARALR